MKGKLLIIILTFIVVLSFNATFASEHGNETLMLHESALELSVEETPEDTLTEEAQTGTFKDLKDEITKTTNGGELKLEKDYSYNSTTDTGSVGIYTSVLINKPITIDGQGHTLDGKKSKTIFTISSATDVTLKNLIFKNGYSTGNGGAINAGGAHNLKIVNCTFIDCIAPTHGGAVFMSQCANVTITDTNFTNNAANETLATRGGAIYWFNTQREVGGKITGCHFTNNEAHYGGAVYMDGVNGVTQYNNHYRDNLATNFGGDIFCTDNDADFHDCTFTNSHANNYGGSIYWKGSNSVIYNLQFYNVSASSNAGAIYFTNGKNMTVKKSSFRKYEAKTAGALYFSSPDCTVVDCEFEDGKANLGGSIYTSANGITIKDSTFKNHSVTETGGTVYVSGSNNNIDNCEFELSTAPSNRYGGIVYVSGYATGTSIKDSVFRNGSAHSGGAIYTGSSGSTSSNTIIVNNEFTSNHASNLGGAVYLGGKDSQVTNNRFTGNDADYYGGAVYSVAANAQLIGNNYTNNKAKQGGAIFLRGNSPVLDGETFIDNLAIDYGGALILDSTNAQINNSYFRGNNATYGSAIFKGSYIAYINNPTFIYNQAHSKSLTVERNGNSFKVTFKANDNILNAIWNNGEITGLYIDGANPVDGVENSNNGELTYQDIREYNQIITATVLDREGNVLKTLSDKTDLYGSVTFNIDEGYKVVFAHPEDVFYTGIETTDYVSSISMEKNALSPVVVNGTVAQFQIIIKNTGYHAIENLTITEESFNGLTYIGWDENTNWTNNGLSWTYNNLLGANQTATLTVCFNTTGIGVYTNKAVATSKGGINANASADVKVIPDNFEVRKVSLMPITKVGDQTIFEIIIHNTGEEDIHNVFIIEDKHEGLIYSHTYDDQLWDYTTTSDGKHKWTLKNPLPGHEVLGIIVVFNTTEIGNYTNYAIVGHEGLNKTVNATVWVNETVYEPEDPNPQLNISIFTVHPVIMVDGEVWFEVTVENTGNIPLNSVTIEEFEHENLIFEGFEIDSPLWDYKPKTLSNPLKPGILAAPIANNHAWTVNVPLLQNEVLGFFVKFTPVKTGTHSNTVIGHSEETTELLYATDHVLVQAASYTVEKIALNSTVNVGEQVSFKIIVYNTGDVELEGLEIIENPDESLVFDHWTCQPDEWGQEGNTHYYLWMPIAPGNSSEFIVVYNTTKAGNFTNTVIVDGESYNATVEVVNKTDNETAPDENQTTPIDDDATPDEEDEPIDEIIPDNGSVIEDDSTQTSSIYSAKMDEKATGNPLIALIVVILSLVLIRRRH